MDLLKKWGVDDYRISPISYTGRSEELNCGVTPEEYREFLRQLKEYEKSAGEPQRELLYSEDLMNCGIGMSSLTVRSDGSVAPCPPFPEEISLGDIRKDSIRDIWNNSEFLKKARSIKASENDKCRECPHINVCQGGCLADIYMRTGELLCGDPYQCAYFSVYNDYTPVEVARKRRLHVEIR